MAKVRIIYDRATGRIKTSGFIASDHPVPDGCQMVEVPGDRIPDTKNAFYRNGTIEYDEAAAETLVPYDEKRRKEYPPFSDQLDMLYWDTVNGTTKWKDKIAEIKTKYPKPEVN